MRWDDTNCGDNGMQKGQLRKIAMRSGEMRESGLHRKESQEIAAAKQRRPSRGL